MCKHCKTRYDSFQTWERCDTCLGLDTRWGGPVCTKCGHDQFSKVVGRYVAKTTYKHRRFLFFKWSVFSRTETRWQQRDQPDPFEPIDVALESKEW